MKELSIQLNQNYKSFNSGFKTFFDGDFIILSGINGSGKSQLMDIIRQVQLKDQNTILNANITLDGYRVKDKDIIFRSFKETLNIPEILKVGISKVDEYKNQIWSFYQKCRLDINDKSLEQFQESASKAKEILIKKFGEKKFDNNEITQEDIDSIILGDFLWTPDDPFTNVIGELIFDYTRKILRGERKCGNTTKKFDSSSLGVPPWIQLNKLFSELNFEYRFENKLGAYFLKEDSLQLNKSPQLYQLKKDGTIDKNDSRNLADLSDGEKAIIWLIFASFSNNSYRYKKILLLDEFDATFNPSLTESFYKLIDKYFISKGIVVVIAMHSPVTISLAPQNASFYEVFSKIKSKQRIFPVQQHGYNELRAVNKSFYNKINDPQKRISFLKREVETRDKKLKELSKFPKKVFLCEDEDSSVREFWKVAFKNWGIENVKIVSTEGCTKFHQEDIFIDKIKEKEGYNPKVFRQVDRDGLIDKQVEAYEDRQNKKISERLNYKLSVLPVNAVENFAVLTKKELFDDSFWENNEEEIMKKFERTAISRCLSIYNLFNRNEVEFENRNGEKMQEMRDIAKKNKNMFLHGKKIVKNNNGFDAGKILKELRKEDYPKELKDYLDNIKLFF